MQKKRPSSLVTNIVVFSQGLLTCALLIAGLGVGFSVPKPIPLVLALAVISGAAFIGLITRQGWAVIPAALLIIGLVFFAFLLIGVGSIWMPGIEFFFLAVFGLVILVPIATIVVSIMARRQKEEKGIQFSSRSR
jgi:uncharacterized membrane protein YwaF